MDKLNAMCDFYKSVHTDHTWNRFTGRVLNEDHRIMSIRSRNKQPHFALCYILLVIIGGS